jgi:hypothetical protein
MKRQEAFAVVHGMLFRSVTPLRGRPYRHACPLDIFAQVAHAAEELGSDGFTLESLIEHERAAGRYVGFTRVAVALAFLRERGILDVRLRRNYAATDAVHLDAMTEYHALAEES